LAIALELAPGFDPPVLAVSVVGHVRISKVHQLTADVLGRVSCRAAAIDDDLGIAIGEQVRSKLGHSVGLEVDRARDVTVTVEVFR